MAFYRHQLRLDEPDSSGVKHKDHLLQAQRSGAVVPELAHAPQCPFALHHVWKWYQQLASGRTGNGFGPNPLTYEAIDSWSRRVKVDPTEEEVTLIKALDNCYLEHQAKNLRKSNGTGHRNP